MSWRGRYETVNAADVARNRRQMLQFPIHQEIIGGDRGAGQKVAFKTAGSGHLPAGGSMAASPASESQGVRPLWENKAAHRTRYKPQLEEDICVKERQTFY